MTRTFGIWKRSFRYYLEHVNNILVRKNTLLKTPSKKSNGTRLVGEVVVEEEEDGSGKMAK